MRLSRRGTHCCRRGLAAERDDGKSRNPVLRGPPQFGAPDRAQQRIQPAGDFPQIGAQARAARFAREPPQRRSGKDARVKIVRLLNLQIAAPADQAPKPVQRVAAMVAEEAAKTFFVANVDMGVKFHNFSLLFLSMYK